MGFFCHIHMMDNFLTNEISIVLYHYYLMDFSMPFTFKKNSENMESLLSFVR